MQYQSIIRLFDYCNIEYGDNVDLVKIKKILSAEFSIATGGIITIDNFDYSKNDCLEELESTDFSERLRCHKLIWKQQSLLNYLEQNIISFSDICKWIDLKDDIDFVKFVSPYFATSFDKVMGKILNLPDFEDAKRWMNLLDFVNNPEDEDRALNSLRIFLIETTKMLRNINSTTYISFMPQIQPWAEQRSGLFLNKLPDSLYKIKEDLVRAWVDFTFHINPQNMNLCYNISCELTLITGIDQELIDVILHNHDVFTSKKSGERGGSGCANAVSIIFLIPVIIFFIKFIIMISTSTSENKYSPKVDFPMFHAYEKVTSNDFLEIRDKYTAIVPAMFNDSIMDKDKKLFTGSLEYIMLERPDTCKSTTINIVNNSADCSLGIYVMASDGILFDFVIDRNDSISIEVNKNTLDFAFRIINEKKPFPLLREISAATLVSDYLTMDMITTRTIKFDYTNRVVNIDKSSSGEKEFTLLIYSRSEIRPDTSPLIFDTYNYMTFRNVEWCLIHER